MSRYILLLALGAALARAEKYSENYFALTSGRCTTKGSACRALDHGGSARRRYTNECSAAASRLGFKDTYIYGPDTETLAGGSNVAYTSRSQGCYYATSASRRRSLVDATYGNLYTNGRRRSLVSSSSATSTNIQLCKGSCTGSWVSKAATAMPTHGFSSKTTYLVSAGANCYAKGIGCHPFVSSMSCNLGALVMNKNRRRRVTVLNEMSTTKPAGCTWKGDSKSLDGQIYINYNPTSKTACSSTRPCFCWGSCSGSGVYNRHDDDAMALAIFGGIIVVLIIACVCGGICICWCTKTCCFKQAALPVAPAAVQMQPQYVVAGQHMQPQVVIQQPLAPAGGWTQHVDPASGRPYWSNAAGQTTWENPFGK